MNLSALKRLTAEQKLIAVNILLFFIIGVGALMLMAESPELPQAPDVEQIEASLANVANTIDPTDSLEPQYPTLGQRDLFAVLVPMPTPTPTPPPTPVPPPSLAEAIKDWKLGGFGPNLVFVSDLKTQDEWVMDLDDPANATKTITFQNREMVIRVEPPIDMVNLTVTFSYTDKDGKQTVTKALYAD